MSRKTNNRGSSQPPKGRSKTSPKGSGGSRGRALAKGLAKKKRQQLEAQRRRRRQFVITGAVVGLLAVLVSLAVVATLFKVDTDPFAGEAISDICYNSEPHAYDIHAYVTVKVTEDSGQESVIRPEGGVGDEPGCFRAIHTHKANGELHVHMDRYRPVTLGDFFEIWGQPFNATNLLNRVVDANHEIVMTVDGEPSEDLEGLILVQGQQIEIEFRPIG